MQVAFVVNSFPMLSETFVINQITGLIDRGHEVDIYPLMDSAPRKQRGMHAAVDRYKLIDRTQYAKPLHASRTARRLSAVSRIVSPSGLSISQTRAVALAAKAAGLPIISTLEHAATFNLSKSYDVIDCQFGPLGLIAATLRRAGCLSGKLVTRFRGYDISKFIRVRGESVYDYLFEHGDLFLPNCDFFRNKVIGFGAPPDRTISHYSGIDLSIFNFKPRQELNQPLKLMTIGRLTGKKGFQYAIDAIAQLRKSDMDIQFTIVGEGEDRQKFECQIQELELDEVVQMPGEMPHEQIVELLHASDLFIAPSITSADGDQDAPVNTLKEAMATGLPCIGTRHGGIPELVEHEVNGLLVPECDAHAISKAIHWFVDHPERQLGFAHAARAKIEAEFDMEKLNDRLINLYDQIPSD